MIRSASRRSAARYAWPLAAISSSQENMRIDTPFNTLTKSEYLRYISNHKKHSDFNTLGLYRSLLETDKLTIEQKMR